VTAEEPNELAPSLSADALNNRPRRYLTYWMDSARTKNVVVRAISALLSDASPAYAEQEADAVRRSDAGWARAPAPRQIADHIMTVAPRPEERS
jgi:hypothetical protein